MVQRTWTAEAGDFEKAVATEEKAISDDNSIAEFQARLALYKSHQPYREPITIPTLPIPARVQGSTGQSS